MEDDHSMRKTTQYSRPIEFVSSNTEKTLSTVPTTAGSTGSQVANLYKSITSNKKDNDKNKDEEQKQKENDEKEQKLWCPDCELNVPLSFLEQHVRGIVHRTSSSTSTTPTEFLALNGSNIGFQLLKSQGWKYEEGLGPKGQGRRHPIATALKQDTLGLGHEKSTKRRITHTATEIEEQRYRRRQRASNTATPPTNGKLVARQERKESRERVAMLRYLNS
ncbi:hypothetical protein INT45_008723 [Circinella minor]|uniref:G-patch domain-containing protein n=1 Tax=Circinella minor TaxID=1195481 RepID=A0A8H7S4I8_9FUNG|nr:hypothetical protein INT45_008723 [Circinella minor]